MEEFDLAREAMTLATSAWRRDFERNPQLQSQVHSREVESFFESLKQEAAGLRDILHPEQALDIGADLCTVTLVEGHKRRPVALCHINSESVGRLVLQYNAGSPADLKSEARLLRMGEDDYAWFWGGRTFSGKELARCSLASLLKRANTVISDRVSLNPNPLNLEDP